MPFIVYSEHCEGFAQKEGTMKDVLLFVFALLTLFNTVMMVYLAKRYDDLHDYLFNRVYHKRR